MAKKKPEKEKKKSGLGDLIYELIGIAVFVLTLLMLGNLGLVGIFLRRVTVVTFGDFFGFLGVVIIVICCQMIVSRKKPKLISQKNSGIFLVFTAIVILGHTPVWQAFIEQRLTFTEGIGQFYLQADVLAHDAAVGGGIYGAFIYFVFADLVTWQGLWLIALLMMVYGTLLFFDVSVKSLYDNRKKGILKEAYASVGKLFARFKKREPVPEEDPTKLEKKVVMRSKPERTKPEVQEEEPHFKIRDFTENLSTEMSQPASTPKHSNDQYVLPPMDLLKDYDTQTNKEEMTELAKQEASKLEATFVNFDVRAKVSEVHIGPTVTRYEVVPESGVKVNRITGLIDDIALALAVKGVRMEAPIPGKSAVGIEVPNKEAQMVSFKEIMEEMPKSGSDDLLISLGRDIAGLSKHASLNKMPHLLVAGATGSGKSVCINTMICSILMRFSPEEVKLLLVDPKKVELARYNGLPHLLAPVVTDPQLASAALKKVVAEMERRYELFASVTVRDVASYNAYVAREKKRAKGEEVSPHQPLPFIVVILDELADLMMVARSEVEDSIMRLTQMARAAGIHLVVATQRPSVDVITGVIKSNIPSRIAFGVSSGTDSRTILDSVGAEKLLGRGDMLFLPMGESAAVRVQGAFISDDEVARVVEFIKGQELDHGEQDFLDSLTTPSSGPMMPSDDPLIRDVLAFAFEAQKVSTSMLQRRFKMGYNRAARLVDELEAAGLVGTSDGSKGRAVLMDEETYRQLIS